MTELETPTNEVAVNRLNNELKDISRTLLALDYRKKYFKDKLSEIASVERGLVRGEQSEKILGETLQQLDALMRETSSKMELALTREVGTGAVAELDVEGKLRELQDSFRQSGPRAPGSSDSGVRSRRGGLLASSKLSFRDQLLRLEDDISVLLETTLPKFRNQLDAQAMTVIRDLDGESNQLLVTRLTEELGSIARTLLALVQSREYFAVKLTEVRSLQRSVERGFATDEAASNTSEEIKSLMDETSAKMDAITKRQIDTSAIAESDVEIRLEGLRKAFEYAQSLALDRPDRTRMPMADPLDVKPPIVGQRDIVPSKPEALDEALARVEELKAELDEAIKQYYADAPEVTVPQAELRRRSDALYATLLDAYQNLYRQHRKNLESERMRPSHPEMQALDKQIREITRRLVRLAPILRGSNRESLRVLIDAEKLRTLVAYSSALDALELACRRARDGDSAENWRKVVKLAAEAIRTGYSDVSQAQRLLLVAENKLGSPLPSALARAGWTTETKEHVRVATPDGVQRTDITYYINTVGMRFVLIPAPESEERQGAKAPKKLPWSRISLPFFFGVCELNQKEWSEVMGTANAPWKRGEKAGRSEEAAANNINMHDATAFLAELSMKEGLDYRLPTADEWLHACMAGARSKWYFGDNQEILHHSAWCPNNTFGPFKKAYEWYRTSTNEKRWRESMYVRNVGLLLPNAWGLHDILGNVSEWSAAMKAHGGSFEEHLEGGDPSQSSSPVSCELVGLRAALSWPKED